MFEAGFSGNRLYCRVDILNPSGGEAWDIVEVKSTNDVKDEQLYDVAFQRHCCQLNGVKINHCHIMHLNREYVKQGDVDPRQLFVTEDVTDRLAEFSDGLEMSIAEMLAVIDRTNARKWPSDGTVTPHTTACFRDTELNQ